MSDNFDFLNTPASSKRALFEYEIKDKNLPPVVSIITPFFNTGEVFYETAKSVFRQSLQQWEWIIVNDASSDEKSLLILDEFRSKDYRIKVIDHKENRGLSASRNTGIKNANSKYLFFLDSDDLIEPLALEKLFWFLYTNENLSFAKGYTVGFGSQNYLWTKGFEKKREFLKDNFVTATAMVKREVFERIGGFDESRKGGFEDWDFWLKAAENGFWGDTLCEFLDWYRRRDTHSDRWSEWSNKGRERFLKEAKKKYPKLFLKNYFPDISKKNREFSISFPKVNLLKKRKKRVLMIIPWLEMGGADNFNLNFLSQMIKRDWEVTIVTTYISQNRWKKEFLSKTCDIFFLHTFLDKKDYPRFLLYLINSRDFDSIMISNSEFGYKILPFLKSFEENRSYVDYNHMEQEEWMDGGYPKMGVIYQKYLDLNGVTSKHLKNWMIKKGADEDRIRVCYINVDTSYWKPDSKVRKEVRDYYNISYETPIIFYAARICPQKKPKVFIKTIKKLKDANLNFKAIIAGDGEDFEFLKLYIKDYSLEDRVLLLGAVPNKEVNRIMKASDIFFLSSKWEGIALSIYEAMACGVAVVGSDVGGQRELVTKECGILISPKRDEEEIEEYFEILRKLLMDKDRLKELGKNARERIEKYFTLDKMGDCMNSFLNEALRLHKEDKREVLEREEAKNLAKDVVETIDIGEQDYNLSHSPSKSILFIKKIINSNKLTRVMFEKSRPFLNIIKEKKREKEMRELEKMKNWVKELEKAKKWLEEQNANKDKYIDELKNWIKQLEEGKSWLEKENEKLKKEIANLKNKKR